MSASDELLAGLSLDDDSDIEDVSPNLDAPQRTAGTSPAAALFGSPHSVLTDGTEGGSRVSVSLFSLWIVCIFDE